MAITAPAQDQTRTPRWPAWRRRAADAVLPLLPLAALFVLWTLASRGHWMSPQTLPSPATVWQTAGELFADDLLGQLGVSLLRLAGGLAAGIAGGLVLGIGLGYSRRAHDAVLPTFLALAQIPTLAWIPLFVLLLGIGDALKLVVIVKAVIVPATLHVLTGVRDVAPKLRETAHLLGLRRVALLRRLIVPAALPSFMAGLRLALAQGWIALLAVELLASSEGIGYLVVWGRQMFQLDIVFVCIAVIGAIGALFDYGIARLDRVLVRWPPPPTAELATKPLRGFVPWLLPAALLAAWTLATYGGAVRPEFLPPPRAVLATLAAGVGDGTLPTAMAYSLLRALGGLCIGGALGIVAGLLLGLLRPLDRVFGPGLGALRQIAIFAWMPLITAWFGFGETAKLVFVSLSAFFPLYVAAHFGARSVPLSLIETARVLRLRPALRLRRLIMPNALPAIFSGLRIGFVYAWLGAIGAEYFASSGIGIGSLMINAQQEFRMDRVMAGMLLIGIVGSTLVVLGGRLERRATQWRRNGTAA
nr:ABC transporter permease [Solimonas soli]